MPPYEEEEAGREIANDDKQVRREKLTPGWKKETHGDKILYVNHAEKSFSWVPPVAMEDAHAGKLEAGQAEMAPEADVLAAGGKTARGKVTTCMLMSGLPEEWHAYNASFAESDSLPASADGRANRKSRRHAGSNDGSSARCPLLATAAFRVKFRS